MRYEPPDLPARRHGTERTGPGTRDTAAHDTRPLHATRLAARLRRPALTAMPIITILPRKPALVILTRAGLGHRRLCRNDPAGTPVHNPESSFTRAREALNRLL